MPYPDRVSGPFQTIRTNTEWGSSTDVIKSFERKLALSAKPGEPQQLSVLLFIRFSHIIV